MQDLWSTARPRCHTASTNGAFGDATRRARWSESCHGVQAGPRGEAERWASTPGHGGRDAPLNGDVQNSGFTEAEVHLGYSAWQRAPGGFKGTTVTGSAELVRATARRRAVCTGFAQSRPLPVYAPFYVACISRARESILLTGVLEKATRSSVGGDSQAERP